LKLSLSIFRPGAEVNATVGDRAWQVPQEAFVAAWNAAATLDEVVAVIRTLAAGVVPRWAVMARAAGLRRDGVALKPLRAGPRTA
jgi:hypothetical protein